MNEAGEPGPERLFQRIGQHGDADSQERLVGLATLLLQLTVHKIS